MNFAALRGKIAASKAAPAAAPVAKPVARPAAAPVRAVAPAARPAAAPRPARPAAAPIARAAAPAVKKTPFGPPARVKPQGAPRSLFAGVGAAQADVDATYEGAGHYLQRIEDMKVIDTQKGTAVVITKTILHVFNPEEAKHRVGEEVTHFIACFGNQKLYFLKTINGFLSSLFECDSSEIDHTDCDAACSDDQPLRGMCIEVNSRVKPTESGNDFTRISYKGRIRAQQLADLMTPEAIEMFFPNDGLVAMAEREAAESGAVEEAPADEPQEPAEEAQVYELEDGTPCDAEGNPLEG